MYDDFPEVKVGDRLTAAHVNKINAILRQLTQLNPGSFGFGQGGRTASLPPFEMRQAIVVEEDFELGRARNIQGMYEIRFRYYDRFEHPDEESSSNFSSSSSPSSQSSLSSGSVADIETDGWKTDREDVTHFLDMREAGSTLDVGDKLSVYYDGQRGAYMPVGSPGEPATIKLGFTATAIPLNGVGQVAIIGESETGVGNSLVLTDIGSSGSWGWVGASNYLQALNDTNSSSYIYTNTVNDAIWIKVSAVPPDTTSVLNLRIRLFMQRVDDIRARTIRGYALDGVTPITAEKRLYPGPTMAESNLFLAVSQPSPSFWTSGFFLRIITDPIGGVGAMRIGFLGVISTRATPDTNLVQVQNRVHDVPAGGLVYVAPIANVTNETIPYEVIGGTHLT